MKPQILCLAALLLAGCSKSAPPAAPYSAAPVAHKTIGDLAVTLTAGAPLHVGDNMFKVTLADAVTQAPISGATVTASAELLSPVTAGRASAGKGLGNGVYQVPIPLSAAGRYDISLHIARSSVPATDISFPFQATQ